MKTISRSHWRKRPPYRTFGIVVGVVVLLSVLMLWREALSGLLWQIGEPILKTRIFAGGVAQSILSQVYSKTALVKENEILRAQLASSSAALLDRDLLLEENVELRRRLGGSVQGISFSILGNVIQRPPAVPYDTFVLDVGEDKGVEEGDLVSAGGSSIIGSVSQVYENTSRITLLSSPGVTYPASLRMRGGVGEIPLTITGQGGGSMKGEVPSGTQASVGDFIILNHTTPILTGIVSYIERKEGNSFEVLYFHLPINIFELRFVEVYHTPKL